MESKYSEDDKPLVLNDADKQLLHKQLHDPPRPWDEARLQGSYTLPVVLNKSIEYRRKTLWGFIKQYNALRKERHENTLKVESYSFLADSDGIVLYVTVRPPPSCLKLLDFLNTADKEEPLDRHLLCQQLAEGLDFVHTRSPDQALVHAAIRGENIYIDPATGRCILGLFSSERIPSGATLEQYPNWIAPELVNPAFFASYKVEGYEDYEGEYRRKSDIFALGCTFAEIYAGKPVEPLRFDYTASWQLVREKYTAGLRCNNPDVKLIPRGVWEALELMFAATPGMRPDALLVKDWFRDPSKPKFTSVPPVYAAIAARRLMRT